jgi:adenine-specific DNA-methyltransferase
MNEQQMKDKIAKSIQNLAAGNAAEKIEALFQTLGYSTTRKFELDSHNPDDFLDMFGWEGINQQRAMFSEWKSVDFLFQLTEDEIKSNGQLSLFSNQIDKNYLQSYIFLAISLRGNHYSRTDLSNITREVNRQSDIPILVLFRHGEYFTLSIINRRPNKKATSKDVLEKITLIKDINTFQPHRAHIEILFDLSLPQLYKQYQFTNFDQLHDAWQKTLDTSELNKRFFKEVANWYFWAVQNVTFPEGAGENIEIRNATSVIRLITRLIFVWFLKEKGLVPDDLFNYQSIQELIKSNAPEESTYYKAILQNLFFATLNQEMNTPSKPDNRKFRNKAKQAGGRDQNYMVHNVYRYEDYFHDSQAILRLFDNIPFLNGGLFECLDKPDQDQPKQIIRIDGFSERQDNRLNIPNCLFFSESDQQIDLNDVYGTKNKRYTVRGLINIFHSYKFTVTENTPIEEEIALDPELLGKVFENLLAAYNPETNTTARKQTGSFYTPREIVDYMVDEALIACLEAKLSDPSLTLPSKGREIEETPPFLRGAGGDRLRHLFAYNNQSHQFTDTEVSGLIEAIDHLKILDPACGSGAFPMGILHKLVFILTKLDPQNRRWKEKQIAKANEIPDSTIREKVIEDIEQAFEQNELDYGRKLYLIENCIYGVDIQPIAIQISKLRFFISLIVHQNIDNSQENRGVRPLPNLETKFVAANALLGIKGAGDFTLRDPRIEEKEKELAEVRRSYFMARTPKTKAKYRELDDQIRHQISEILKSDGFPSESAEKLAIWKPYEQNTFADFFDAEWMFGITDGFDITIGNPPYVRADVSEQHLVMRKLIELSGLYETLWEKWDLYIPFIELGYKLLKPNGFTTMIVSDAFCHSKYAKKPQEWYLKNSKIIKLDFLSKIKVFEAGVFNITYLFQKADGSQNKPELRVHYPKFGVVTLLPTDKQKKLNYRAFFPGDTATQQFSLPTLTLKEICYISVGMVVHADEKIAQGEFKMEDLVSNKRSELYSKPFVEGKHLGKWLPATNKWLEWGTYRAPAMFRRPTFPQLYEINEKLLVQRSPGPDPKACYDNQRLHFTESSVGFIPWHTLSGICNNSIKKSARYLGEKPPRPDLPKREELEKNSSRFAIKYLLAIMNSTPARDFLRANRRSNIHLYPDDWKQLPIPDATPEQQALIVKLVDKILAIKRKNIKADVSELEAEIDQLVYQL